MAFLTRVKPVTVPTLEVPSTEGLSPFEKLIVAMTQENFTTEILETIPFGIALPLREAIARCRNSPPPNLPPQGFFIYFRVFILEKLFLREKSFLILENFFF